MVHDLGDSIGTVQVPLDSADESSYAN